MALVAIQGSNNKIFITDMMDTRAIPTFKNILLKPI
jgi:hypothetical protein